MLNRLVLTALLIFLSTTLIGQNKTVKFEDIKSLQTVQPKPIVVLIMTDWCKYCHAMQHTMLKNSKIASLLSSRFYTIFLNAEEKKDIFFAGRLFKYRSGLNELAQQLALKDGKISYPTICILNSKNEIVYQHDGYLSAQAMEYTLKKLSKDF